MARASAAARLPFLRNEVGGVLVRAVEEVRQGRLELAPKARRDLVERSLRWLRMCRTSRCAGLTLASARV